MLPLQFFGPTIFGLSLLWFFVLLVWCILGIVLAVWVYRDAESRGMNGALWLIIVILLGLIGFLIYLIVKE